VGEAPEMIDEGHDSIEAQPYLIRRCTGQYFLPVRFSIRCANSSIMVVLLLALSQVTQPIYDGIIV
jgi:hypothetical protein